MPFQEVFLMLSAIFVSVTQDTISVSLSSLKLYFTHTCIKLTDEMWRSSIPHHLKKLCRCMFGSSGLQIHLHKKKRYVCKQSWNVPQAPCFDESLGLFACLLHSNIITFYQFRNILWSNSTLHNFDIELQEFKTECKTNKCLQGKITLRCNHCTTWCPQYPSFTN